MSDLFIGEILVLVLLVPVLLRPFIRGLQRMEGIAILPLVSFLVSLLVAAGPGLRVSFLPVLLLSFIVFLSGLFSLIRMWRKLPTDWFSPVSVVWHCILIILFALTAWVSVLYAPEDAWVSTWQVRRSAALVPAGTGVRAVYTVWEPVPSPSVPSAPASRKVVVFAGDATAGAGSRNTAARILAENGYTVLEADYSGWQLYRNPLLALPSLRKFFFLASHIASRGPFGTDDARVASVSARELALTVQRAKSEYGESVQLFALAEGSGVQAALAAAADDPGLFSGVACLAAQGRSIHTDGVPGGAVALQVDTGVFAADAGSYPVLVMSADPAVLYGYGELCADDVLAAKLLGGVRDVSRKECERTARRLAGWFELRRTYDHQ
jgi:hypothetical protein